jgi:hypothetical protein
MHCGAKTASALVLRDPQWRCNVVHGSRWLSGAVDRVQCRVQCRVQANGYDGVQWTRLYGNTSSILRRGTRMSNSRGFIHRTTNAA